MAKWKGSKAKKIKAQEELKPKPEEKTVPDIPKEPAAPRENQTIGEGPMDQTIE